MDAKAYDALVIPGCACWRWVQAYHVVVAMRMCVILSATIALPKLSGLRKISSVALLGAVLQHAAGRAANIC